jgi:RNA polymerase sigma-70 factor, ECF subfamily
VSLASHSDLYRKYAPAVYRYALSLTGHEADAEDLVSTTFLRLWTSDAPIQMVTVRAYLMAIARNLFLEGLRKHSREQALDFDVTDNRDLASEHEARAEWKRLRILLAGLPEGTRSALVMHSVLEMPYSEIAQVLNLPVPALKVRVHRARLLLAEKLGRKETPR